MQTIREFNSIKEYLHHSNLKVNAQMEDFVAYSFEQINHDAELSHRLYRQNFFEISLELTKGCCFTVDGFSFDARGKRMSVIGPRRLQSMLVSSDLKGGFKGFSMFFSEDFLFSHLNAGFLTADFPFLKASHSPVISLSEKSTGEMENIFRLMLYEFESYGNSSREVLKSLLGALLLKAKHAYTDTTDVGNCHTRECRIAAQYEDLCSRHFLKLSKVEQYADLLNVSPKHLSETVKKATGKNALHILNNFRIQYAKTLLVQSSLSPTQIGYELNFDSPEYFFTFFKRSTGVTPSRFRQIQSV
jgi:AraC-like DNA-binding protein